MARTFPPHELLTPRLRLRLPRVADAQVIFRSYAADPEVTRYLTWFPHQSVQDTRGYLRLARESWRTAQGHRAWQIVHRKQGTVLGAIGTTGTGHHIEVGYVLARAHWGRGYMTEALLAVIDAAFQDPRIWRVGALCDVENVGSARVMEKAGLVHEGVLRGWVIHPNRDPAPRDVLCYSLLRPDWEAQRKSVDSPRPEAQARAAGREPPARQTRGSRRRR